MLAENMPGLQYTFITAVWGKYIVFAFYVTEWAEKKKKNLETNPQSRNSKQVQN